MKKKSLPITSIGTVSLMMIFIVLCMITFAALSLTSASSDARLGRKTAEHMTEYYTASNKAEEMLAYVDDTFSYAYKNTKNKKEYYQLINKEFLLGSVQTIWSENDFDVLFQTDINDSQALEVLIDVLYPGKSASANSALYKILSWKVINTETWESDNTLHLIQ